MKNPSNKNTSLAKLKTWFAANREALAKRDVLRIDAKYSGYDGIYEGAIILTTKKTAKPYRLPGRIDRLLDAAVQELASHPWGGDSDIGYLILDVASGKLIHHRINHKTEEHSKEEVS